MKMIAWVIFFGREFYTACKKNRSKRLLEFEMESKRTHRTKVFFVMPMLPIRFEWISRCQNPFFSPLVLLLIGYRGIFHFIGISITRNSDFTEASK